MKSPTENGAGSDGASPLIVVRLLDRLPLLYQILDLTAEISLHLGQRVLRIRLIRVEERIARQKQRPPIINARHHFEHGSDALLLRHRTIIGRREPNLPIDCIVEWQSRRLCFPPLRRVVIASIDDDRGEPSDLSVRILIV